MTRIPERERASLSPTVTLALYAAKIWRVARQTELILTRLRRMPRASLFLTHFGALDARINAPLLHYRTHSVLSRVDEWVKRASAFPPFRPFSFSPPFVPSLFSERAFFYISHALSSPPFLSSVIPYLILIENDRLRSALYHRVIALSHR